ncbi:hypothetical protein [Streptomyces scopuliridis]|uniref:hypothetical protein n=1 Tax=Streptomyces scopuliridis TaxID=452529 RepID=UPI0035DDF0BE
MSDVNPGRDEVEDVAAMRREGDLKRYLRDQLRAGRARRNTPSAPSSAPLPPGHRPGTWPTGISPPDPIRPETPGAWAAAVTRYRSGDDLNDPPCECGGCQTNNQQQEEK